MTSPEANMVEVYAQHITGIIEQIQRTQMEQLRSAAKIITTALADGGILRTFGAGHSALVASDLVYRAGGFAPVDLIAEHGLSGLTETRKSEFLERLEGYSKIVIEYYDITPPDVLLVVSNSGRNAAPIEMAIEAKKRGIPVIAVTSLAHSRGTVSRHSSGAKLFEIADIVIDNCCPLGDAVVSIEGMDQPTGPTSGLAGFFIVHSIMVQVAANMLRAGVQPPVFGSGNLDGMTELNGRFVRQYGGRIRAW